MTYLLFDAAIAVVLLLAVLRGYRKGFVLTLCGFLAIFVAFIGATVVSNALAEPVSQAIRPVIEQNIQAMFTERVDDPNANTLPEQPGIPQLSDSSQAEEAAPNPTLDEVLTALKDSQLYKGFVDAFQKAVDSGVADATANAVRAIAGYIAKQIAQMVLFLVSFVLILILWFFLSHALDLAFKLPVLSTLNRWSGAALGLLHGGLLIFIACWLLKGSFLPQEAVGNSVLLHWFCTVSPLDLLAQATKISQT